MSPNDITPLLFKPAFCHRADCEARRDAPFCSRCGADVAAYVEAVNREEPGIEPATAGADAALPVHLWAREAAPHDAVTEILPPEAAPAAPVAPVPTAAVQEHTARPWRDPLVLGTFAATTALGAALAVVADLV
jgi:hypothetical protein